MKGRDRVYEQGQSPDGIRSTALRHGLCTHACVYRAMQANTVAPSNWSIFSCIIDVVRRPMEPPDLSMTFMLQATKLPRVW